MTKVILNLYQSEWPIDLFSCVELCVRLTEQTISHLKATFPGMTRRALTRVNELHHMVEHNLKYIQGCLYKSDVNKTLMHLIQHEILISFNNGISVQRCKSVNHLMFLGDLQKLLDRVLNKCFKTYEQLEPAHATKDSILMSYIDIMRNIRIIIRIAFSLSSDKQISESWLQHSTEYELELCPCSCPAATVNPL